MKKHSDKLINLIISLISIVVMWLIWLIAAVGIDNRYVVPSVGDTFSEFIRLLFGEGSAEYWTAFGMTVARSLGAWLISCVVAALLAALSALNVRVRAFIKPFIAVVRILPVMAITLMLLIWSTRSVVPIIVSSLTLCPLMYAQFMAAFDGIDRNLLQMAKVYKIPRRDKILKIYLPQIAPSTLAQTGANISLSLKVVISAEVLASTFRAIGGLMNEANLFLNTAQMFALTISMLITGGLLEWGCSFLTRITDRWQVKEGANVH